ncbi:ABC transporter permease [Streptomyces sp. AC495_CC817]|uniref:ABC transporter permease n=1 Tax=Streptomyces sp. AC495_CC817 TaxID=2823900 RepID=UPI001C2562B4|nr:ABC transporter permease [Streptomyces sp. AC495_CC817]
MIVVQAATAVVRRWRRNMLTLLALSLSAGAICVIVIVAQGSALHVVDRLQGDSSSRLTIGLPSSAWEEGERDTLARMGDQPGVYQAGTLVLPEAGAAGAQLVAASSGISAVAGVAVATSAGLQMRSATLVEGAEVSSGAVRATGDRSVLLGVRIADELGVSVTAGRTSITVNGVEVNVAGIVRDGGKGAALSASLILTPETAEDLGLLPRSRILLVDMSPSVVSQMARVLPYAFYPGDPSSVSVEAPPNPQSLRAELLQNANDLVVAIGLILVGVTAFTIVTTLQIAVMERRREIGIARALGRTRVAVASGFLVEAALLSTAGSSLGALVGIVGASAATTVMGWSFVVPPVLLLIPVLGLIVGALAGAWPALVAARTDPAELLRS